VWSTFYDIRRYGGLQVFLRAVLHGSSLVLSSPGETAEEFVIRAVAHRVTHITGTPSHWRRALMGSVAARLAPRYVRLSGEIADQAILNSLRSLYPQAQIAHAFASTEAGVAFDVTDGLAGFPADTINGSAGVEMKVVSGSLRIQSARTASHYLGTEDQALKDEDGFVDTGDMVELRDGRYHFVGRGDGMINVGGLKVHPEEVEDVINRHPEVQMSLVKTRKNPVIGAVVVADVVLKTAPEALTVRGLQQNILQFCREALPAYKVPVTINVVPSLSVSDAGKLVRCYA